MTAGDGDGGGTTDRPASRGAATVVSGRVEGVAAGRRAQTAAASGRVSGAAGPGGGQAGKVGSRRRARRAAASAEEERNVTEADAKTGAELPIPRPLVAPTPGVRLLAAVVLAAVIGTVGGGLAAWAIYLHLGPVQHPGTEVPGTKGGQAATSVSQLAAAAAPSLVAIATQPMTAQGLTGGGSAFVNGVIVSTDGLILTSAHAVAGASQLRVGLADGRSFDASIAAADTAHGLVLLRITGASGLAAVPLASVAPGVGDAVVAVFNPPGVGLSVSVGTISAVGERITSDTATGATLIGAATIDSTPEPNADGAPVLDSAGQLAGIVASISAAPAPPGITVLSIDAARGLIARASGSSSAAAGTFGVESTYLDPAHAAAAGLTSGALVASVVAGGPAATAGLRPGDVVTSVDGHAIDSATAFNPSSLGLGPGDTAALTVVRGTTTLTLTLTVGSGP